MDDHFNNAHTRSGAGDCALWLAALNDADAFGEICERHIRTLHAYARRRAGEAVAADLTAETLAQAWRCRRRLRPHRDEEVVAWLHGIAANVVRRYLRDEVVATRARARLGMQLGIAEADATAALDDRLDAAGLAPQLNGALRRLPVGQRRAVVMRVVEDQSYDQIGRALGCSEPVARMKVARGLRALRAQVQQKGTQS